jgi:hypothetical protein
MLSLRLSRVFDKRRGMAFPAALCITDGCKPRL